jgi:ATP-dependent Clp protease protease subunit
MIHQPLGGLHGQVTDMEIRLDVIKKDKDKAIKLLSGITGKSEKEVHDAMERDNFMSASEAKSFGLIDEVLEKK